MIYRIMQNNDFFFLGGGGGGNLLLNLLRRNLIGSSYTAVRCLGIVLSTTDLGTTY